MQSEIQAKIDNTKIETVEKLCEDSVTPSEVSKADFPTINWVSLSDIWNTYNSEKSSSGFGDQYGCFWSCVAVSSNGAFYWDCNAGLWLSDGRQYNVHMCVLVSRTFS